MKKTLLLSFAVLFLGACANVDRTYTGKAAISPSGEIQGGSFSVSLTPGSGNRSFKGTVFVDPADSDLFLQ